MARFLVIDDEGYVSLDGLRVEDPDSGAPLLENLWRTDHDSFMTKWDDQEVYVEAFDEPLVAKHVESVDGKLTIVMPYGVCRSFDPLSLCLDEWDRFHGITDNNISFVFSRHAQFEFFDLLEAYDDDSITWDGKKVVVPPFFKDCPEAKDSAFWNKIYTSEKPGWEFGQPADALTEVLPQLKLNKSRVFVPGCGSGHDAAHFAKLGHLTTAVDFSSEAIARARQNYSGVANLDFVQSDIFALPASLGPFDLIFDHACWPAITPERRGELISSWRRLLAPGGHLLAIFLLMSKRGGPPFGASEWELRERLKKNFRFLYWTRWRRSNDRRMGRELVVFAQKI